MGTNDSFSVLLIPYFADSTNNFTSQMQKFGTVFMPDHIMRKMQAGLAKAIDNLRQFLEFDISGGPN